MYLLLRSPRRLLQLPLVLGAPTGSAITLAHHSFAMYADPETGEARLRLFGE